MFVETFKIGDIVARKSYNFDILFKIVSINRLGLLGFIISILYFINFVVLLKNMDKI